LTDQHKDQPIAARITDRRRVAEIIAVALTGLGKFVFMDHLGWKFPYISIAIIGWVAYILLRHRAMPGMLHHWGFRTDNFAQVARMMLPFVVVSMVLFVVVGAVQGTINPTWHVLPLFVLYPLWGAIQQFLMIGLIAGNLQELRSRRIGTAVILVVTALLFASVHFPDRWLIIGTFVLSLFYGYVYLKQRNVYVMGIVHGWLGALFYYTVVDRDPFIGVFGKFLH
jgi:uncharacterized protein